MATLRSIALLALTSFILHAAEPSTGQEPGFTPVPGTNGGYAHIVERVAPAVVTVASSQQVLQEDLPAGLRDHPLFRDFFGRDGWQAPARQGLGSGVIIDGRGYILTNHHVVANASEVRVRLGDGIEEFTATVVGGDAKSDLAVLKIDPGDRRLPTIPFADSSQVKVGDIVLAVGNPFGVGQTVTMGIVSATGRGVGILDYEDFLQTDASINPGNSGGALVDVQGRLIGINTAIVSPTGSNLGIGFAVPANMARAVTDSILTQGRVVRGYLGVVVQPVTPALAQALSLDQRDGALIGDVAPDSPAAAAGLRPGDVITAIDGETIADPRRLRLRMAAAQPGSALDLTVIRRGEPQTITVEVAEFADAAPIARQDASSDEPADGREPIGVRLSDLNDTVRDQLRIPEPINGAVVVAVEPQSPAAQAGLRPGDVIHEIAGRSVATAGEAADQLRATGDQILLRVWSEQGSRFVVIEREGDTARR